MVTAEVCLVIIRTTRASFNHNIGSRQAVAHSLRSQCLCRSPPQKEMFQKPQPALTSLQQPPDLGGNVKSQQSAVGKSRDSDRPWPTSELQD